MQRLSLLARTGALHQAPLGAPVMNVSHSFGKALADVLGHRGGLTQHLHGVRLHFAGPLPAAGGDVGRNHPSNTCP